MIMKKLFAMSAIGLAMGFVSASATAEGDGFVEDYVTNPYGEVWRNSYGECWRDRFAATEERREECGYSKGIEVIKEVIMTPAPAPVACPDVIVLENLHFDFDSTEVHEDDKQKLTAARDFIHAEVPAGCNKTETILVTGHTDSTGPTAYNQGLSLRRAEAVISYLRSIDTGGNLVAEGKGESSPVADNSTKAGRAQNRRVVIDIDVSNN